MTRKANIIAAALSGLPIDPRDLVSVSRDTVVVMRHRYAWPDNADGRVLHAVSQAVRTFAQEVGNEAETWVDVVNYHGDTVYQWNGKP